jgi:hypothetical protein
MIVGILGKKRSGKDTTGDYLVANKNFVKYSFANPIKRGAMELFGFTEEQVFGDAKDEIDPTWGITPRLVLQIMGGAIWSVNRPNLTGGDEHASEKEMDLITGITSEIINDRTLHDLYDKIDNQLNDLRKSVS